MNILIFHSIPYPHVEYHRGIDHSRHDVTYFGPAEALATVPEGLRCSKVARPGAAGACEEARSWMAAHPCVAFDRVIALSEGERLEAARLREWLGLPGDRSEKVAALRNKLWMKQAVAAAGLRVPRFASLPAFLARRDGPPWQGRTVLKPHSGAASEDVAVFATAAQARAAVLGFCSGIPRLDALEAVDACGDFEVEEYVEGPVLHFDGVVAGGTVFALAASRYLNTCLDYARGAPLGSIHIPLDERMRHWVARALEGLGMRDGCFHLEAIEQGGELVFLEIDHPVDVPHGIATFERATGIHLPSVELHRLLGEAGENEVPPLGREAGSADPGRCWHGWFAVPGHHLGCATHPGLEGIAVFRRSEAVVGWSELPAGAPLPGRVTYRTDALPLAGIVATAAPPQTQAWMESLFAAVQWKPAAPHAVPEAAPGPAVALPATA